MYKAINKIYILIFFNIIPLVGNALQFPIQDKSDIIGAIGYVTVQPKETIFDIARKFDIGSIELTEANPQINPNKLKSGDQLTIPTSYILPPGNREGIIINLAELRIYYFPKNTNLVVTHPVGIGRIGWKTPIGETKIVKKVKDPTWYPPKSIRASYARKGKTLPLKVPPGPKNPLGNYAMRLSWNRYLIHGTNKPQSIGFRSSSGCIRMYPEDIESLFYQVPKGTKVRVIHEPYKIGKRQDDIYIEAHEPFVEEYYNDEDDDDLLRIVLDKTQNRNKVKWPNALNEVKRTVGYPIIVN